MSLAAPNGRQSLPLLTPEYPELSVFTQRFSRTLYSRLKPPFVLVFDDYHDVPRLRIAWSSRIGFQRDSA